MVQVFVWLLYVIMTLAAPALLLGWIKLLKARMQGRKGPPLLQPYRDLLKWFRKDAVISQDASWITAAAPYISVSLMLTAALMVPLAQSRAPLSFSGDIIVLFYLLAAARFISLLAALDAGSNFGGMGASRELAISSVIEPALFLSLLPFMIHTGSTSFIGLGSVHHGVVPAQMLAALAYFFVLIAETGRIPVDNPDTHLELTMVHEGMILEFSGRYLALTHAAAWLKQWILVMIGVNLFLPDIGIGSSWLEMLLKTVLLGAIIAVVETFNAKMRMYKIPYYIGTSMFISLIAIVISLWG